MNQERAKPRPLNNQDVRIEWLSNIGLPSVSSFQKFKLFSSMGNLCCLCKTRSERLLLRLAKKSVSRIEKSLDVSYLMRSQDMTKTLTKVLLTGEERRLMKL